jgi:hypothetical protein
VQDVPFEFNPMSGCYLCEGIGKPDVSRMRIEGDEIVFPEGLERPCYVVSGNSACGSDICRHRRPPAVGIEPQYRSPDEIFGRFKSECPSIQQSGTCGETPGERLTRPPLRDQRPIRPEHTRSDLHCGVIW